MSPGVSVAVGNLFQRAYFVRGARVPALVTVAALAFQMPLLAKSSIADANAIRSLGMSAS
jgi:hypothetical protein